MPDIIYYDLNKFPIDFVLATYNEVSREPFTFIDFSDGYKSNEFKLIISKDSKEQINKTLEELNLEYRKEFSSIIDAYGGDVHEEKTSKALAVCREKYQRYFERLQDALVRHYKFYNSIKKNGDIWVESGENFAPLVSNPERSISLVKGSVVLTEIDKDLNLTTIEIYDDTKHKLEYLKMFLLNPNGEPYLHYLGEEYKETEMI